MELKFQNPIYIPRAGNLHCGPNYSFRIVEVLADQTTIVFENYLDEKRICVGRLSPDGRTLNFSHKEATID
jgi:hypothetical protein